MQKAYVRGTWQQTRAFSPAVIVSGEAKAEIVGELVNGEMTNDLPGSWIRQKGEQAELIVDKSAASKI